ncbi:MAG: TRAP transporter substrate-binding protein DctP, partial [Desulfobacterales bacterium]|nr:TRAP transporter substrate-binding protein DctP [Desulfobacterales bacterium]
GYAKASGGHAIVADVYYGQRHVTSNKPIKTPEDMKGLKIRVPNAPLYRMFPEAVGGKTSPIAFAEVYLALQQGVVDAQENPLPTIKAKKFYEVQKYINLTGHLTGSNLIIIGAPLWKRLSDEDKAMFSEVLKKAAERVTADIVNAENELVEWFRSQGVTVLEIDRKPFRDMTVPFHMGAAATWTQEQYDKLQAIQ